ncbi:transcriptional regulator domain-containing protein [Sphingomonas psychrotolerans]|uniref:transcriptional regulator domain-containing protein n=1 Tax=Sphingomonas psychrotolerans TaxID=1327635 RepID=UPI00389A98B3
MPESLELRFPAPVQRTCRLLPRGSFRHSILGHIMPNSLHETSYPFAEYRSAAKTLPTGSRETLSGAIEVEPFDWQAAADSYAYLAGMGHAGIMWEFHRRDAGYLAWHAAKRADTGLWDMSALDWGLHFRGRSRDLRRSSNDHLVFGS